MVKPVPSARSNTRGVVLISTLISCLLIAGLALAVQTKSLSTIAVLKRLEEEQIDFAARQAVHALIRPLVAEAMYEFDQDPQLSMAGEPHVVTFEGRVFHVAAFNADDASTEYDQPQHVVLKIVLQAKTSD